MSAIGGIIDLKNFTVDFATFNRMRLSLSLRGRIRSSAFIGGSCCMFFNSSSIDAFAYDADAQPRICERRGHSYVLCIDGDGQDTSALMERYMTDGVSFLGAIDGAFSLSLYDGERDILILARDRRGKRPLFYRSVDESTYFSSEPKGILGSMDGYADINREALASHLTSAFGVLNAAHIYSDISEVAPGECIIFSRMGNTRFFYREERGRRHIKEIKREDNGKKTVFIPDNIDTDRISDYLSEALIAFDIPQFDAYMPSLCELLRAQQDHSNSTVIYEDHIRRKNRTYAYERDDRIGNLYGIRAIGVPTDSHQLPSKELYQKLVERFLSLDGSKHLLLRSILGEDRYTCIMQGIGQKEQKKEDTENNIRILGMLCQTVDWVESGHFVIRSDRYQWCC